ncbi:MAG: hypothetical protein U0R28_10395 [Candidatus Nanopelagicales bacterium]
MSDEVEVRARLARLPHPPMPASVTAAIEARLAEERTVVPLTRTHRSRLNWLVAAAAAVAFVSLVGVSTTSSPAPVAQTPVVRAGAVFEPAGFAEQLRSRMGNEGSSAPTATFADSAAGITACMNAIKGYGPVMSADAGTYGEANAVVLVTRYVGNAQYEEVWVVAPDCGTSQTVVMRHILVDVDG